MASIPRPLGGPIVTYATAKCLVKGEDTISQDQGFHLQLPGASADPLVVDAFGVFDGHGGKQAATYAAKHLLSEVAAQLPQQLPPAPGPGDAPPQLKSLSIVPEEAWPVWETQDRVAQGLPRALSTAFQRVHDTYIEAHKGAGTTATLAVLVGWELFVANVGDSCAYLDTGSEVIQVSGNHRLEGNKAEIQRCQAAGCEVQPTLMGTKYVGPLRVWPGGLAMSRTLGDADAGKTVLAEPEVRQVTIPTTGARLIIASDGLWDAVNYKTAAHHARGLPATKAAPALAQQAHKAKGQRDDISVVVVDLMLDEGARMPPCLEKNASHFLQAEPVVIFKPLESDSHSWTKASWDRRLAAARVRAGLPAVEDPTVEDSAHSSSMTHVFDMTDGESMSPRASFMSISASEFGHESAESILCGSFSSDVMESCGGAVSEGGDGDGWETVAQRRSKKDANVVLLPQDVAPQQLPAQLPAPQTPIRAGGKRQSRRLDNSYAVGTGTPPSPAMFAKGKKPTLPSPPQHVGGDGGGDMEGQGPALPGLDPMQLASPVVPALMLDQPPPPPQGLGRGRGRGNERNRFGRRQDQPADPAQLPPVTHAAGGASALGDGRGRAFGGHHNRRPRAAAAVRQVGFEPAMTRPPPHLAPPAAPGPGGAYADAAPGAGAHPGPRAPGGKPRYNRRERRQAPGLHGDNRRGNDVDRQAELQRSEGEGLHKDV